MTSRTVISEGSKITVGVLVGIISLALYLAADHFKISALEQAHSEMKAHQDSRDDKMDQLITDVAVIRSEVHETTLRVKDMSR